MKKIMTVVLAMLTLLMVGCGNNKEAKMDEYKRVMEEYSEDYFKNYVSGVGNLDILEVTISMLENANTNGNSNYDLTKLEGCAPTSRIMLILNDNSTEVERFEHDLDCEEK